MLPRGAPPLRRPPEAAARSATSKDVVLLCVVLCHCYQLGSSALLLRLVPAVALSKQACQALLPINLVV